MTRIYISKQSEGWKEIEIPENFKRYSYDALIGIMHRFINLSDNKGILITENPKPEFQ